MKIEISKEELYKMYIVQQLDTYEISNVTNCSQATICRLLKKYNIKIRSYSEACKVRKLKGKKNSTYIFISKSVLEELYLIKKMTPEQIGRKLGCSSLVVSNRLKEHNIKTRNIKESMELLDRCGKNNANFGNKKDVNGNRLLGKNKPKCIDCGKSIRYKSTRCRECYNKFAKGINSASYKNGLPNCIDCNITLTSHMSTRCTKCAGIKKRKPRIKENISTIYEMIRALTEYKEWRSKVFNRDNFTCQECGCTKSGNFNAHHIKHFNIILQEFLALNSTFSQYDDKNILIKLAINYKPFWDIDNGITLCKECHKLEHKARA